MLFSKSSADVLQTLCDKRAQHITAALPVITMHLTACMALLHALADRLPAGLC